MRRATAWPAPLDGGRRCYGGYLVTPDGTVYSKGDGKPLKQYKTEKGYAVVYLCIRGKTVARKVHRLVAELFVPNPEGKPEINHIDGDKMNNRASNLEWSTRSENIKHAYQMGLRQPNNTRRGRFYYTDGVRRCTTKELAGLYGVNYGTLRDRRLRGQDINQALGLTEKRWAPCD